MITIYNNSDFKIKITSLRTIGGGEIEQSTAHVKFDFVADDTKIHYIAISSPTAGMCKNTTIKDGHIFVLFENYNMKGRLRMRTMIGYEDSDFADDEANVWSDWQTLNIELK